MLDSPASSQWPAASVYQSQAPVFQELSNYCPTMPVFNRNTRLGTPQAYYGMPLWTHASPLPQQAPDAPQKTAQVTEFVNASPMPVLLGSVSAISPAWAQQSHQGSQNISFEKMDQGVSSIQEGKVDSSRLQAFLPSYNALEQAVNSEVKTQAESGVGMNHENPAQKLRKGIRNKAIKKTDRGVEVIDVIPIAHQALLEGAQQSQQGTQRNSSESGTEIPASLGGLNVLDSFGTSDWTPADVSSACAAGPPGLGHRRAYRSPAKRQRDIARLNGRDLRDGEAPIEVAKGVTAVEDGAIEQATMSDARPNTGPVLETDQVSLLSVSAMLKWRSVVVGECLSERVEVCSARFVESGEPAPKNWREQAALSQQKKENKKGSKENELTKNGSTQPVLEISENSWAALQKQVAKNSSGEEKSDEEIVRLMKSILNKLTMKKYDTLYQQILNCGMSTVEHVMILIDEVLEKAESQHHFIQMYCQFCVDLHRWFVERESTEGSDMREHSFKRILLNKCQNKFEENLKPPDLSAVRDDDVEEAMIKHKLAKLGNIKFIGALLEKGMLNDNVLIRIAQELCNASTLESLACFLTAVGPTFDQPSFRHYEHLQAIFGQVKDLSHDRSIAARICFLLQDLLDLRNSGWGSASSTQVPQMTSRSKNQRRR